MALALLLSVQGSILNGRAVWCSNRCFTYNASMQPFVIALTSDSAEGSDTVACVEDQSRTVKHGPIGAPCLGVSSPVCIHGHMDDVVQLSHPREIQYTSLASFEVTRDSLQFCLGGCGWSCCLSHEFLRTEGNVEALFCQMLTDSNSRCSCGSNFSLKSATFSTALLSLRSRSGH